MELSDHGYEVLLQYLTPADTAALRLVSRNWQALVDRCLTTLQPFAVTTAFFSLSSTPCLVYRSPFQHGSVRHHPLDYGPSHALHAIAGQFTALHTLSVDCATKAVGDFEGLRLVRQLRRLHLAHFSFADEAFRDGLGGCCSLQVLHLESQQAMLQVRSLRHLTGLSLLQELVLKPRGYIHVPPTSTDGLSALGQLTTITQLQLLTALKPPRHSMSGEVSGAGVVPLPDHIPGPGEVHVSAGGGVGGHPLYFSAATTNKLSDALGQLKLLKVLWLTGVHTLPAATTRLTQLVELSVERVGRVDRPAVASLCCLQQLTALTIITAADALDDLHPTGNHHQQQQLQQQVQPAADDAPQAAGSNGASSAAAAAGGGAEGLWLPLLGLPRLCELVLGSAHRSQQLSLTGKLTDGFGPQGFEQPNTSPVVSSADSSSQRLGRISSSVSSGSGGGGGGGSWYQQAGQAVVAYVCPSGAWSDLAGVQGLQHVVVVRSWHSAAVTAMFPSFAAAVGAYMAWPQLPASPLAAAATSRAPGGEAATAAPAGLTTFDWHHISWCNPSQWYPQAPTTDTSNTQHTTTSATSSSSSERLGSAAGGAVGVFYNHPNQGCFVPSMPALMVLALRPTMGALGPQQRLLVAQLLQMAGSRQAVSSAGGQLNMQPQLQQQGLGHWNTQHDSTARSLLLAQLRSSMHHSKLLLVLAASATALTRLELTVDQSWPPSVLASLGQLKRLQCLSVLKLDCGRQQPTDAMWEGLSRLTSLRWLCLRWLDKLPVSYLAPLTNLVALQLKNIDKPPGAAQLAEVLHGMPHLTALAIEGSLLDADEDWLRAMTGLMRHGRWTSSWVEHILCREYRLRVLGSITGALLMSALLNSPKWPEMLASALLAAVAGAIFVMAVAASLVQLLFDPQQLQQARLLPMDAHQQQHQRQQWDQQQQQQQSPSGCGMRAASCSDCTPSRQAAAANVSGPGSSSAGGQVQACNRSWLECFWGCLVVAAAWLLHGGWAMVQFWLLGGWLAAVVPELRRVLSPASSSSSNNSSSASGGSSNSNSSTTAAGATKVTWLSFVLRLAALRASFAQEEQQQQQTSLQEPPSVSNVMQISNSNRSSGGGASQPAGAGRIQASGAGSSSSSSRAESAGRDGCTSNDADSSCSDDSWTTTSSTSSSTSSLIVDPGSAFRRLRFLSLRRCTLSHSNNSVSNKLWQLSVLASQPAPGLGSQLVAVVLALVLWPLAVAAAISRIAATSGSFEISSGGYSYHRDSRFAVWAWGWDLICGLLQGAANRVEGAAAGCGPVVAVASCMPELRFLDLTWINLEPWELHAVVQLKQLHYLGLSRQQVGVVMSREAVFARNCNKSRRQVVQHHAPAAGNSMQGGSAGNGASAGASAGPAHRSWSGWLLAPVWGAFNRWPLLYIWPLSRVAGSGSVLWGKQQQQYGGRGCSVGGQAFDAAAGLSVEWPSLVLMESPSGFDDALEREFAEQ